MDFGSTARFAGYVGRAIAKIGPRRVALVAARADAIVAALLTAAEKAIQYAVPKSTRTAATVYLASASGMSASSRLSNAACAAAQTGDGLPLTVTVGVLAFICGYLIALLDVALVPLLVRLAMLLARALRRLVLSSRVVRGKVDLELEKIRAGLAKKFSAEGDVGLTFLSLPDKPLELSVVDGHLEKWSEAEVGEWVGGRKSGTVYHGQDKQDKAALSAFRHFSLSNPMHSEAFPAVRRMEAEVLAMTLSLFHGPVEGCGALTSGGTESILMAVRAYRQQGRARGIDRPNLVVPDTVHAAFDKACDYFCIELRRVPCDPLTQRAVPKAMKRRMDSNTIALVCSAVAFPHGTHDPVAALATIAKQRGVGLHVDCCLGSFLLPFAEEAGFPLSPFDFRAGEGVTSMSIDHHKYGLAPKGVSCVLFRTKALRSHMYTRASSWTGGIYATATQAGSRPGALIAGAWAAMVVSGRAGYLEQAEVVLEAAAKLAKGIQQIEGLKVVGEPALSVVAFTTSGGVNVFDLLDSMSKKKWELNALQRPDSLHACVTRPMATKIDALLADLAASMKELELSLKETGAKVRGESAALYGMTSTVPLEIVDECIDCYLDTVLSPA